MVADYDGADYEVWMLASFVMIVMIMMILAFIKLYTDVNITFKYNTNINITQTNRQVHPLGPDACLC